MEKQYLSGIHQDPISTSCVPVSKFSFLRLQVRFCFLSLNSAVIRLDDQLMSLVVLGVSLGEGGVGDSEVPGCHPSGTSGLHARKDWLVSACWVTVP